MPQIRSSNQSRLRSAAGFTLIEMLVSVALVLIMMTLFAQVFQMAGSSISKQRGLAENDQRSRTLQTIIKADLDKRTCRWVYPFAAGEDVSAPESYIGKRQGFLYISENNPNNKLDDVLHLTIASTMTARNKDTSPYYGKALNLTGFNTLNEPDADDAQALFNNTGLSTVAEVVYFVRNGNLYRRQLLVREPLPTFSGSVQPADKNGNKLFDPNSSSFAYPPANDFWNDYDYSAYMGFSSGTPFANFSGTDSLDNSGATAAAISKPPFRYGFSPAGATGVIAGRPKEFAGPATTATFMGRFTMQESSDLDFKYPQSLTPNGNIPTDPSLVLGLDPIDSIVNSPDDFTQGTRRGEDLLISNVHGFDVQVWDEMGQSFVNIGDPFLPAAPTASAPGYDYAPGNRYCLSVGNWTAPSPSYGPRTTEDTSINAINAVYDTWHPKLDLDTSNDPTLPATFIPGTGQPAADEPPYRPVYFRPAVITNASGVFDRPSWSPNITVNLGDVYFPSGPPQVPPSSPPFVSGAKAQLPYGSPFYYRCISAPAAGGTTGTIEPGWPKVDSVKIGDNNLVWQAVENRKPLRAIKIEVRFIDPSTQQMRQLTVIQSLVD